MQRIDNSGAVASLPAPLAAGTPGYFGRGNPSTGLLATPLSADWANMVQEEIMRVLEEAGITPDKAIYTQLRDSLRVLYRGQRSGSQALITGNTALTAEAHGGGIVIGNSGSAIAATMMAAADMLTGRRVAFFNENTGAMTVQRTGTDTFKVNNTTVTSLVLGAGDSLVLESDGAEVWYAVDGSVQLRYAAAVAVSAAINTIALRDGSGGLTASQFNGPLNGNANTATTAGTTTGNSGTATKLLAARSIALGGDLAGSANFDGSANITITAAVTDDSHSHSAATSKSLNSSSVIALSGTSTDVTGIPSDALRVSVLLAGASGSGTSFLTLQVGHSGGVLTTGYEGVTGVTSTGNSASATAATNGFSVEAGSVAASHLRYIEAVFTKRSGNVWVCAITGSNNAGFAVAGGGMIDVGAVLDRIRVTTRNGTDTLDAGDVIVRWER